MSDIQEWYLEYKIHENRPGLLGDIASVFGMLSINIVTINGLANQRRAVLLQCDDEEKMEIVGQLLNQIKNISVIEFRPPSLIDRLVVRHGRYINRDLADRRTFRFCREDIGILVDFMGEIFKREGHQLIGVRGMPRVGKTESIIAASVTANKRWTLVSSTLLRQTVRTMLAEDEMNSDHVFIIDGIVSTLRSNEAHQQLVREVIRSNSVKVIEHPDIFIRETEYGLNDFDYLIELRNDPDEVISYEAMTTGFNSFDIS